MSKGVRLNTTHCFIMKIRNQRELQQIASNYSSGLDLKDFKKLIIKMRISEKIKAINNKIEQTSRQIRQRNC